MSAKRFAGGLFLGALATVAIWLALWAGQLGRSHPNNAWIEASIAYKLAIAQGAGGPKIVTVAGSGALFGIDSALLEQRYGVAAVNLGVNAGISLPVILGTSLPAIGQDDLVLLPLEYPLYNRFEPVSESLVHWMNGHPEMLLWLPRLRALKVVASTSTRRIFEGYRGIPEGFTVAGDYGPQRQDSRGDQIDTSRSLQEERHRRFLESLPAERYGHEMQSGRLDHESLQAFRDAVLDRGACPVFLPPPLRFEPSYLSDPVEAEYYRTLPERLRSAGLKWLGDPYDAMRPGDDFFDTNFHLMDEARQAYTEKVIAWLGPSPLERCRDFHEGGR
ncbi:hypothetical protein KZO25_03450 [Halomonas sp. ANAO-440]|uniref:hypothetical protein n=1 Tax=Halomonas sp. ANAO-440 TaxID=2861360 RepID=UPI001CAA5402|nr:hypothetical protein [Halomonas sp. ANAO-440]MBZ0329366.1 hypothetical protein [Halomonas sp. ANAO-440]